MKTSFSGILLPLLILFSNSIMAQRPQEITLVPKIDERVELLSIVFRLAGNEEYNNTQFKIYTDDIHHHFDPFKDHPLIVFAKDLVRENHIGYDAVMSMAVALNQPPLLTPLVPFTNGFLDSRWSRDKANKFALRHTPNGLIPKRQYFFSSLMALLSARMMLSVLLLRQSSLFIPLPYLW